MACTASFSTKVNRELPLDRDCLLISGHADHDWVYEIIDDWLYLTKNDLRNLQKESESWRQIPMESHDEAYKQVMQTGSRALYFAKCKNENTTWLPLLEKAYAKAYGDYASLKGGYVG